MTEHIQLQVSSIREGPLPGLPVAQVAVLVPNRLDTSAGPLHTAQAVGLLVEILPAIHVLGMPGLHVHRGDMVVGPPAIGRPTGLFRSRRHRALLRTLRCVAETTLIDEAGNQN